MNVFELHPDHLVDAMREGRLTASDRVLLEAHCVRCSACMFELRWLEQSPVSSKPSAADRAYGRAAFDTVLRRSGPRSASAAAKTIRWSVRELGIGGVLLACGVSAALFFSGEGATGSIHAVATLPQSRASGAAGAVECAAPLRVKDASPRHSPTLLEGPRQPVATLPSANQLLASARLASTRGEFARAERLYRQVVGRYASASAAGAAQLALGRLLYEVKAQPAAALREFEEYLRRRPRGALTEEALFFQALSLYRLGKVRRADDTLHKLLRLYPATVYAAPARIRLSRQPTRATESE